MALCSRTGSMTVKSLVLRWASPQLLVTMMARAMLQANDRHSTEITANRQWHDTVHKCGHQRKQSKLTTGEVVLAQGIMSVGRPCVIQEAAKNPAIVLTVALTTPTAVVIRGGQPPQQRAARAVVVTVQVACWRAVTPRPVPARQCGASLLGTSHPCCVRQALQRGADSTEQASGLAGTRKRDEM